MFITTNAVGREICAAALDLHKKMVQSCGALARRLELPEKPTDEALSANEYTQALFAKIPLDELDDVAVDFEAPSPARALRVALIAWGALATKRDQGAHKLAIFTDTDRRKGTAQEMVNALSEQLQLPLVDLSTQAPADEEQADLGVE